MQRCQNMDVHTTAATQLPQVTLPVHQPSAGVADILRVTYTVTNHRSVCDTRCDAASDLFLADWVTGVARNMQIGLLVSIIKYQTADFSDPKSHFNLCHPIIKLNEVGGPSLVCQLGNSVEGKRQHSTCFLKKQFYLFKCHRTGRIRSLNLILKDKKWSRFEDFRGILKDQQNRIS